jgi:hypothetical protein
MLQNGVLSTASRKMVRHRRTYELRTAITEKILQTAQDIYKNYPSLHNAAQITILGE